MKIDFVVLWVDGNDASWLDSFNFHRSKQYPLSPGIDKERFRDMNILKYLFRSFEKYSPWVNNIHFVTCGHYPDWLDVSNPKIKLVKHSDFIPASYLPTFNSTTIEMFLNRIPGLSEYFVYFNDDMFLNSPVMPSFFFIDNKPCDFISVAPNIETDLSSYPYGAMMHSVLTLVNSISTPKKVVRESFSKYFNVKYGIKRNIKNLYGLVWWGFLGFELTHSPQAFTKKTFESVWGNFDAYLSFSARSKFREPSNISQYLFRFYQLVTGNFSAVSPKNRSVFYNLTTHNLPAALTSLTEGDVPLICLNDSEKIDDFEFITSSLVEVFRVKFPEKSSYEL